MVRDAMVMGDEDMFNDFTSKMMDGAKCCEVLQAHIMSYTCIQSSNPMQKKLILSMHPWKSNIAQTPPYAKHRRNATAQER